MRRAPAKRRGARAAARRAQPSRSIPSGWRLRATRRQTRRLTPWRPRPRAKLRRARRARQRPSRAVQPRLPLRPRRRRRPPLIRSRVARLRKRHPKLRCAALPRRPGASGADASASARAQVASRTGAPEVPPCAPATARATRTVFTHEQPWHRDCRIEHTRALLPRARLVPARLAQADHGRNWSAPCTRTISWRTKQPRSRRLSTAHGTFAQGYSKVES